MRNFPKKYFLLFLDILGKGIKQQMAEDRVILDRQVLMQGIGDDWDDENWESLADLGKSGKEKLLKKLHKALDTNGDGLIDREELTSNVLNRFILFSVLLKTIRYKRNFSK